MHCVGGHTLVPALFVAVLITLFFLKTFSLFVCIYIVHVLLSSILCFTAYLIICTCKDYVKYKFIRKSFCTLFLQCSGCSVVGFDKSSPYRYIHVDRKHLTAKSLLHYLLHILGRYHEHQREDRKDYIWIIKENIIKGTLMYYNKTQKHARIITSSSSTHTNAQYIQYSK